MKPGHVGITGERVTSRVAVERDHVRETVITLHPQMVVIFVSAHLWKRHIAIRFHVQVVLAGLNTANCVEI